MNPSHLTSSIRSSWASLYSLVNQQSFWTQLGHSVRSTFVRSLVVFSGLLAVVYIGVWVAVAQLFESLESKTQIIAIAASSLVQTAFGVPIGLDLRALDGIVAIDFQFEAGFYPTLLVAAFIFFAAWNTRREVAHFATLEGKFLATVAGNGVIATSISFLLVVQNFVVDRYAVLPIEDGAARFSVASLGVGELGIIFLLTAVGGLSAFSTMISGSLERLAKGLNWFFFVLVSFLVMFLIVATLIGVTVFLQELIDIDFVQLNDAQETSEGIGAWEILGLLGVVLFLPTLLGNLLWLSMGSSFGIQQDDTASLLYESLWPVDSFFGNLADWGLLEGWSAWDEFGAKALLALIPIVLVALFVGAAGSIRASFRPVSFWSLPIFVAGGILSALLFWKMTSVSVGVQAELLFGDIEGEDPIFDDLLRDGLQLQSGGTEVSAVLAALVVVSAAFLGARYLGGPLHRIFPRLMSFVSFEFSRDSVPSDRTRGIKNTGRVLIALTALPPVTLLSLAAFENVAAHRNGADEFAQETVALFLNGEVNETKGLFLSQDNSDWFSDEIIEAARIPAGTPVEITLSDIAGGPLEVNETGAKVRLNFAGSDPFALEMTAFASPQSETLGVTRVEFAGKITPIVVDLALPKVLTDAGVDSVSVNNQSVPPNSYATFPGTYSFQTEGRGIVSGTESSKVLTSGGFSPDFSPQVVLDSAKNAEMSEAISNAATSCSEADRFGKSTCFDTSELSGEPKSLNGNIPKEFYDFAILDDYAVESAVCNEFEDVLEDAFTLTRSTSCVWEVDRSQIYYGKKITRTPVYSTGTRSSYVRECERVYYWWSDDYEWEGCWRDTPYQYQSGTTTSFSRGSKLFEGRFRYELTGVISITAELVNSTLVLGEPIVTVN